jgi:hypothetical protein
MEHEPVAKSGIDMLAPRPTAATRKKRTYAQVYQSGDAGEFDVRPEPGTTRREWVGRLREALGSTSNAFVEASMRRIMAACTLPRQNWPSSTSVSAALALIESLEPENEIQATVAVHIACLDAACANVLSRLAWSSTESRTTVSANAGAKLERAFLAAVNTYYRLKKGNQQVIRIERIDMHAGAQAIVGQVVQK